MKRLFSLCLAALMMLMALSPMAVLATETEAPDVTETTEATEPARPADACGENLTWKYQDGILTVSGSGAMDDFAGGAPWAEYKDSITTVVFSGGVTYVGAYAFRDCNSLVAVDFGGAMHTIGERAFQSCEGLTVIHLPASFRRFASESFEGCTGLTEVWCAGGMPSFNFNCLWNYSSITVYCPAANPWPASAVEELETNFGGRLQVLAADGEDPYDFGTDEPEATSEPTAAPTTEPVTEPTEVPTTEAETEPVTESATEPTTEPTAAATEESLTTEPSETAEETLPETHPTEESTVPTQATEPVQEGKDFLAGKSWIGIVIVAGVLTLLVAGALIVRAGSRGGKYSD